MYLIIIFLNHRYVAAIVREAISVKSSIRNLRICAFYVNV